MKTLRELGLVLSMLIFSVISVHATASVQYKGVNLSGAEYAGCAKTGVRYGYDYIYANTADVDAFLALGMNTFRLPFCWERLQSALMGSLDAAELSRIDALVKHITGAGAYVVLDLHNYARYRDTVLTASGTVTAEKLANVWQQLATHYRDNNKVIFGLMNEPHDITSEFWLGAVNTTIAGIRGTGAKNLILVPGVAWTGAHSWTSTSYGTPNSVSMLKLVDSENNFAYEVHQYLDSDSSGTSSSCVDASIGANRITAFSNWARANHVRGFLGEFSGGRNDTCYSAIANLLTAITNDPAVWAGWTYWSAGAWQSNYMFNIPTLITTGQKTQLNVLQPFLNCSSAGCLPRPPIIRSIVPAT